MSDQQNSSWQGFLPNRAIVMAKKKPPLPQLQTQVQTQVQTQETPTLTLNTEPLTQPHSQSSTQSLGESLFLKIESSPPTVEKLQVYSDTLIMKSNHDSLALPTSQSDSLAQIAADLSGCMRCKLCEKRKTIVLGEGNPRAELVFVGEGPGEQEDLQGRPFVGHAGQLLDKMIAAIGLDRNRVFIANVVKCRPPGNRNPEPDEIATCGPFLVRQLSVIQPKLIVALGKFAAQTLLETEERISTLRGRFHTYRGVKLMPTFHPSYLLRNPSAKREAWSDLQQVAKELGLEIPSKK